ncbi:MAG TPA: alpha/beta hydrolase domain-containing protein [Acidimicrobiia bacterium]|nr:alpha/beta hydrolase domain-containing protein [Acidimicrobiia bacterium]
MTIVGPVTGGAHGWPFGASVRDAALDGYVEEEFFLDGDASLFSLADGTGYGFDGYWSVAERGSAPFRTRILVRRPVDRERFNGVVIASWNNVSAGFEFLGGLGAEVVASGCAWVGASVQRVGVHGHPFMESRGLATWDEERYGTLSIPDDDASFDIFTQIARAVGPDRMHGDVDPMGTFEVEHVLAFGASQSANRIATYYNAIQPVSTAFDGFMIVVYSGGGTRVDALGPGPSLPQIPEEARAIVNLLPFGSHLLRDDIDARAFVLNSETEAGWYHPVRQPDSDTYRLWEVAGAAHSGVGSRDDDTNAQLLRDIGILPGEVAGLPVKPNPNTLSFRPVTDAALHHLQAWVQSGTPPPVQDRIEFAGEPPEIVRDAHGNARGGIRLVELDAPTGTHVGASPEGVPDLAGSSTPFSREEVRALYPDRDRYLARVDAAIASGVARGYYLPRDVAELRAQAEAAPVP